jgi:hypothetical protein
LETVQPHRWRETGRRAPARLAGFVPRLDEAGASLGRSSGPDAAWGGENALSRVGRNSLAGGVFWAKSGYAVVGLSGAKRRRLAAGGKARKLA